MRFFRILFSVFVLAFGFLIAVFLMVLSLASRLFGRRPAAPQPDAKAHPPSPEARPVARSFSRGEVIDI